MKLEIAFFFQNEIKKALDKACTIIPEKRLRRKCREAIERKSDEIVEKIVKNLTAENICKVLGWCQDVNCAMNDKIKLHKVPSEMSYGREFFES